MAFVVALIMISSFNERMNRAIFGRFEYDEKKGTIAGDNRQQMTKVCWELFKEAPVVGHGARNLISISQNIECLWGQIQI